MAMNRNSSPDKTKPVETGWHIGVCAHNGFQPVFDIRRRRNFRHSYSAGGAQDTHKQGMPPPHRHRPLPFTKRAKSLFPTQPSS
jgi:hypothetical protein